MPKSSQEIWHKQNYIFTENKMVYIWEKNNLKYLF